MLGEKEDASELALERKMSVQSVSEQLLLEKSGLVKRAENGKWVYYELTEKSEGWLTRVFQSFSSSYQPLYWLCSLDYFVF